MLITTRKDDLLGSIDKILKKICGQID